MVLGASLLVGVPPRGLAPRSISAARASSFAGPTGSVMTSTRLRRCAHRVLWSSLATTRIGTSRTCMYFARGASVLRQVEVELEQDPVCGLDLGTVLSLEQRTTPLRVGAAAASPAIRSEWRSI